MSAMFADEHAGPFVRLAVVAGSIVKGPNGGVVALGDLREWFDATDWTFPHAVPAHLVISLSIGRAGLTAPIEIAIIDPTGRVIAHDTLATVPRRIGESFDFIGDLRDLPLERPGLHWAIVMIAGNLLSRVPIDLRMGDRQRLQ